MSFPTFLVGIVGIGAPLVHVRVRHARVRVDVWRLGVVGLVAYWVLHIRGLVLV